MVLECNGALLVGSGDVHLDMRYVRYREKRRCVVRRSTLVLSQEEFSDLTNQVDVFTVLYEPYDVLAFPYTLGGWGRHSGCEQHVFPGLRVGTVLKSSLYDLLRRFTNDGTAISGIVSFVFRRQPCWLISLTTSSPRRAFVKLFGGSLFMRLAFLFSASSWQAHGMVLLLNGPPMRALAVKVPAVLSSSCRVAFYFLLPRKAFRSYARIPRSI